MQIQPILTRFLAEEADVVLAASFETGFGHLPRKPDVLYNVRKNTIACPLVSMRRHGDRLLSAAFDARTLRNSLGFLSLYYGVRSGIVTISDAREAHLREVQSECSANYLQCVAARTDRVEDYRAAVAAGVQERDALDVSNASMLARIAELTGQARDSRARMGLNGAA